MAALLDNHIHHGNKLDIDPRRIVLKRVLDMNDRALRDIVMGLGGTGNAFPRESGFDITVASEVMAVFCLSESAAELKERLGRIIVAYSRNREPITAADLNAQGAMAVLLQDALQPNLVQTLENNPAIIHGGPFANIAHGCNSVIATKLSMKLSEYTITEAGFGADLGAEKFMNIKCRQAGLEPDMEALETGVENLRKHIENIRLFGLPVVVAINAFASDTAAEMSLIQDKCAYLGVEIVQSDHWARGGAGAEDLARTVIEVAENTQSDFRFLYADERKLWDKVRTIAQEIYGANDIMGDKKLRDKFKNHRGAMGSWPCSSARRAFFRSGPQPILLPGPGPRAAAYNRPRGGGYI